MIEEGSMSWVSKVWANERGVWKICTFNAELLLENHPFAAGRLRYNSFTRASEIKDDATQMWRSMIDVDLTRLRSAFDGYVSISRDMMFDAVTSVAYRNSTHPVRDYLTTIKWDGTPRLDTLFSSYFKSDGSALHCEAGARWAIGAVARIMSPGCKLDTLPVLEGKQGIFKSSGVAALVPDRKWFADTQFDLSSKDAYQSLDGVWIYEIGEMESFSRADITRLKGFLSSAEDHYRLPYGKTIQTVPRQTVFIGTTNETDYVADRTGERRKWPIPVTAVDLDAIHRDRDSLWAEAVVRFAAGESWYLEGESAREMSAKAMERHVGDPWVEMFDTAIRAALLRRAGCPEYLTLPEIYEAHFLTDTPRLTPADSKRIARALRALGCVPKVRKVAGRAVNTWTLSDTLKADVDAQRRGAAPAGLAPSA